MANEGKILVAVRESRADAASRPCAPIATAATRARSGASSP